MRRADNLPHTSQTQRFGQHSNAFGALRLLFASSVIISHTPEILSGSRDNEILTRIFGTISLGDLAVGGFFLISGYLITASFVNSKNLLGYMEKRFARIYPGFLCAYLVCVLVVAPIGSASIPNQFSEFYSIIIRALLLQPPNMGDVFRGTYFPFLNTSMWTISIEFKCYLLVIALGILGLFKRPFLLVAITIFILLITVFLDLDHQPFNMSLTDRPIPNAFSVAEWNNMLLGNKKGWLRLSGVFLAGSCFYLYRYIIIFRISYALFSLLMLSICLNYDHFAYIGMSVFGGYLLFAVAEINRNNLISRINNKNDISYGVYLYSWPVTKVVILIMPRWSVMQISFTALAISFLFGWASWMIIERPIMKVVRPSTPDQRCRSAIGRARS